MKKSKFTEAQIVFALQQSETDVIPPAMPDLLPPHKRIPIPISIPLRNDHNKVDQIPNAEAAKSQQLDHANAGPFCIETMDAKSAQKEAKKQGGEPVISLHAIDDGVERTIGGRLISRCCSAVRTESGARRDVSAAVRAIHSEWFGCSVILAHFFGICRVRRHAGRANLTDHSPL